MYVQVIEFNQIYLNTSYSIGFDKIIWSNTNLTVGSIFFSKFRAEATCKRTKKACERDCSAHTRTKETRNAYTFTKPVQLVYNKSFVDQFIF